MIDSFEAQKVIAKYSHEAIVVSTMTTSREWPHASTNPDLHMPSGGAMGKTSSVALGLALAQPDRKVIVLDGDGGLLMNLGSLVTIANMAPPNLVHFVFENNVYRTTGGQPIPNAGKTSFMGLAREAGYANMHEFETLATLENEIETVLNQVGPTFVTLKIPPDTERPSLPAINVPDRLTRFMAAVERPAQ